MPADSSNQNSLNWAAIIVGGVISIVVGVAIALILDYVRTSANKLEYEILSSSEFSGQQQKIGMLAIQVQNSGRHELEFIYARIELKDATILESKTSDFPTKGLTEVKTTNAYTVELPYLNPSERGRILLLVNLNGNSLQNPSVELRAKGVVGRERSIEQAGPKDQKSKITLVVEAAFATVTTAIILARFLRMRGKSGYTNSHSDDQRDVAAFVFEMSGLPEEAAAFRALMRHIPYWSLADAMTQAALEPVINFSHIRWRASM
jgi:hypothetical protein